MEAKTKSFWANYFSEAKRQPLEAVIVDQEPLHLRHDGVARRRVDRLGGAGQDRIVSRKQMFKTCKCLHTCKCIFLYTATTISFGLLFKVATFFWF